MKYISIHNFLIIILISLFLVFSCAHNIKTLNKWDDPALINHMRYASEREKNYIRQILIERNPEIVKDFRDSIIKGELSIGMPTQVVIYILGKPDNIEKTISKTKIIEYWKYNKLFGPYIFLEFQNDKLIYLQIKKDPDTNFFKHQQNIANFRRIMDEAKESSKTFESEIGKRDEIIKNDITSQNKKIPSSIENKGEKGSQKNILAIGEWAVWNNKFAISIKEHNVIEKRLTKNIEIRMAVRNISDVYVSGVLKASFTVKLGDLKGEMFPFSWLPNLYPNETQEYSIVFPVTKEMEIERPISVLIKLEPLGGEIRIGEWQFESLREKPVLDIGKWTVWYETLAVSVKGYKVTYECLKKYGMAEGVPPGAKLLYVWIVMRNITDNVITQPTPIIEIEGPKGFSSPYSGACGYESPYSRRPPNTCQGGLKLYPGVMCEKEVLFEMPERWEIEGRLIKVRFAFEQLPLVKNPNPEVGIWWLKGK